MPAEQFAALPPGLTSERFAEALGKFRDIVGVDNVVTAPEMIVSYTKLMIPVSEEDHMPPGALLPKTTEEVQRIVAVCNEYLIPVWPISTGRNFGYGSAAPAKRGTMVLDLRRLNRIIEVNADLGYALVEAGVTYKQLADYIEEHDLPLWLDTPMPAPVASPTGNTLDRGVGYTPYGEHFLFQCGMEVVLANGEVLRTGMGALENSNTWQVFKWGYGPYLDGIFTQSNYGIVTKMGFWLMHKPPAYKPFLVKYPNNEDIVTAIDTIRPLRLNQIIANAGTVSNALWELAVTEKREDLYDGNGQIPDDVVAAAAKRKGYGAWNVYAALYGTPEQVDVNWRMVKGAFEASGGEVLTAEDVDTDDPLWQYRVDMMSGTLSMREFSLYNYRGGGGSTWFAPVSQAMGSETLNQMQLAKSILGEYGFDYVALFIIGWRDMHHIVDLLYDRTIPAETRAAYECYDRLLHDFADEGYGIYRTSTAFMDKTAAIYGKVKHEVNLALKRALDPNGIIAPGKSGIDI